MNIIYMLTTSFSIENLGGTMITVLKTIALWFDWIIYELLTYVYVLFNVMCKLNFSSLIGTLSTIATRIQILLGVAMLFIVAFNLLQFLVDPSKAESGGSKLVLKIVVVIGLLVSGNFIFDLLDNLQNAILESSAIEKIVTGVETSEVSDVDNNDYRRYLSGGRWVSYNLFFSFYENPDPDYRGDEKGHPNLKSEIMNGELTFYNIVEHAEDPISYKFPIISGACGILTILMYVTFSIDIGVRAFTIMILRVIMPVAVMAYIIPEKGEGILKKYIGTYMSTYIQLFVKIFISYLIVYLMMYCMKMLLNIVYSSVESGLDNVGGMNLSSFPIFFRVILLVLIFIALYKFFKSLPSLAEKILGVKVDSGKALLGRTMGIIGGAIGLATGGIGGLIGGIRGKAGFAGTAKAMLHGAKTKGLDRIADGAFGKENVDKVREKVKSSKESAKSFKQYAVDHQSNRLKNKRATEAAIKAEEEKERMKEEYEKRKKAQQTATSSQGTSGTPQDAEKKTGTPESGVNASNTAEKNKGNQKATPLREAAPKTSQHTGKKAGTPESGVDASNTVEKNKENQQTIPSREGGPKAPQDTGKSDPEAKAMGAPANVKASEAAFREAINKDREFRESLNRKDNSTSDSEAKLTQTSSNINTSENKFQEAVSNNEVDESQPTFAEKRFRELIEQGYDIEAASNISYQETKIAQQKQIEKEQVIWQSNNQGASNSEPRVRGYGEPQASDNTDSRMSAKEVDQNAKSMEKSTPSKREKILNSSDKEEILEVDKKENEEEYVDNNEDVAD